MLPSLYKPKQIKEAPRGAQNEQMRFLGPSALEQLNAYLAANPNCRLLADGKEIKEELTREVAGRAREMLILETYVVSYDGPTPGIFGGKVYPPGYRASSDPSAVVFPSPSSTTTTSVNGAEPVEKKPREGDSEDPLL
jgi:hypothetical protein